ncbi:hypothetical protein L1N85_01120 [Paenibacillus alkaliterrae]|uniref:hypothetical protein n=1 Tax=Paenibacillus alkaliterrae TaxID=320909 RepID=UPI001F3DAA8B|nr:hypothetical protein [Paenibacillus alkaliterrae]MCF2937031.1 hypothetical protein [Paenibacillus alkaliterrae]
MLGTWRWNVVFGLIGTVLTVAFSIGNNPISVMLLRSVYAFIAFFVLAYGVRVVLAFILQPPSLVGEHSEQDVGKGNQFDMQTPDETYDLNQLLKSQLQDGAIPPSVETPSNEAADFRPLNPPQLLSAKNTQPEELVKAIRHLTGE